VPTHMVEPSQALGQCLDTGMTVAEQISVEVSVAISIVTRFPLLPGSDGRCPLRPPRLHIRN